MSDKETPIIDEHSNLSEDKKTDAKNAKTESVSKAAVSGADISQKDDKKIIDKKASDNKKAYSDNKLNEQAKLPKQESAAKMPLSKLAIVAVAIAVSAVAASAVHYLWQQEQNLALSKALNEQRQQEITASQANIKKALNTEFSLQLKQQLAQQQQYFTKQLQEVAQQVHQKNESSVTLLRQQLSAQVSQLSQQMTQRQPSDWLIHEAEYLIRIAARTMWLERDTKAAIGLLKEADARLSELAQPKFLPVRALINQDIAALTLMPVLENQQAILALMALNKQVTLLPLAGINLRESLDSSTQENFTLSNDVNDWQTNLKKTWQKFLNDFITVRRRTGDVEPLIAPQQQQNLQQNLSLKIQLAQWAASEQNLKVFQQTLLDIQAWIDEFFDMKADINQKFYQSIEQIKSHTISFDYPSDLSSLSAIKRLSAEVNSTTDSAVETKTPKLLEDKPSDDKPSDNNEASTGDAL